MNFRRAFRVSAIAQLWASTTEIFLVRLIPPLLTLSICAASDGVCQSSSNRLPEAPIGRAPPV